MFIALFFITLQFGLIVSYFEQDAKKIQFQKLYKK